MNDLGDSHPDITSLIPAPQTLTDHGQKHEGLRDRDPEALHLMVAGARNAEYYTVPEVYWIDLS